jgi:hypothetical protein
MMIQSGVLTQRSVIERFDVDTGQSYDAAAATFESSIGRLEVEAVEALRERGAPWAEAEAAMTRMAGPSGLMLFTKLDQGAVASLSGPPIRCRLYMVGNPAIAAQILRIDARASLYVPFLVALYARDDQSAAVLSFDRPSSFLGIFEQPALKEIGLMLDAKIDAVIRRMHAAMAR